MSTDNINIFHSFDTESNSSKTAFIFWSERIASKFFGELRKKLYVPADVAKYNLKAISLEIEGICQTATNPTKYKTLKYDFV